MSVLVIGLSHHSAPLRLLEAAASADPADIAARVRASDAVTETVVVSTCNRLEVYAESLTFHGAVAAIGEALAAACGVDMGVLSTHLYVHYEDRAVAHAFSVACGLDSMAVGEAQVLGQLRDALRRAQETGTVGPSLNSLLQQALRVGKRAHTDTDIDLVSHSLIETGLEVAVDQVGPLAAARVLVVGAGGMSSLAATTVARHGVAALTVVNRTAGKAERLVLSTGGTARPWAELEAALREADVVVTSTGSLGHLIDVAQVERALAGSSRRLVVVDLGLPRDVDPDVGDLPDVTLVGLDDLGTRLAGTTTGSSPLLPQVQAVTDLVTAEVATYLAGRMVASVVPTVAALRSRANEVVEAEISRLDLKLPGLDEASRAEVHRTVHRVVEKLLHKPTVRIKELTSEGQGGDYAAALRELFDLDPHDVAAVSAPPPVPGVGPTVVPADVPVVVPAAPRGSAGRTSGGDPS